MPTHPLSMSVSWLVPMCGTMSHVAGAMGHDDESGDRHAGLTGGHTNRSTCTLPTTNAPEFVAERVWRPLPSYEGERSRRAVSAA
jgi:hypothetical protein